MTNGCGCGCGSTKTGGLSITARPRTTTTTKENNTVKTTTVNIDGMTCGHCVNSVTEEIQSIEGVQEVTVELVAGGISKAVVTSTGPIAESAISEAVAEAGYTVVGNNA